MMFDNKCQWGLPHRKRMDIHHPNEVHHRSQSIGMSPEQLKEVVARVGTSVEKVQESLRKLWGPNYTICWVNSTCSRRSSVPAARV